MKKEMGTTLLISSPTESELVKATAEYYCGSTITLQGDTWPKAVHNSRGPIDSMEAHMVRVGKSGRVRFQLRRRAHIEASKDKK